MARIKILALNTIDDADNGDDNNDEKQEEFDLIQVSQVH